MGKIVTCWGSPASGKTFTSLKLAAELSKNNAVLWLPCTSICPPIYYLFPFLEDKEGGSLGNCLATVEINEETVGKQCIAVKGYDNLVLLGYRKGENRHTYSEYTQEVADDLINLLKVVADYIVVDCETNIFTDNLSLAAATNADLLLRFSTADTKSIAYHRSCRILTNHDQIKNKPHYSVLGMWDGKPVEDNLLTTLGEPVAMFNWSAQAKENIDIGRPLAELDAKKDKTFMESLNYLADLVKNKQE